MSKSRVVIIVAGGKGQRMLSDIPKQFLLIRDKPILMHTIEAFRRFDHNIRIILVIPALEIDTWETLCKEHAFRIPHTIVAGGHTRFFSVKNGLDILEGSALVAVHDGVRPLVSQATIARCFDEAEITGTAIPVVDLVDSIRQIRHDGSVALDRSVYKLVQTPQVFDAELLRKAYEQDFSTFFTDDASVVEGLGVNVNLVEGNVENVKITTEFDLVLVDTLMSKKTKLQSSI